MLNHKTIGTIGLIIGVFLTALEGTVVATAMPAVIADLGGQDLYALPFSIYLLTLTVSSPLWGRWSDLAGRKTLYLVGVVLFLIGSALSGLAHDMPFLIAMRAIQGLGAGCILPLTYTIVGELYTLQNRARIQGYISAVWGISGLLGPLVGGLIVDNASWRWVFYLNLPFGIATLLLCAIFMEEHLKEKRAFRIDVPGTVLLVFGIGLLVWGVDQKVLWMTLVGLLAVAAALPFELRHPAPLLPIGSMRNFIARNCLLNNLLGGAAFFGAIAYIPLFVQEVAGAGATTAGIVLTPMVVGWTVSSMLGARLVRFVRLSVLNLGGFILLMVGFAGFTLFVHHGIFALAAAGAFAGCGMGVTVLATLLMVQENSPKSEFGAATAGTVFARTVGGALGVSMISMLIGEMKGITTLELTAGLQRGFFLGFVLALMAMLISVAIMKRKQGVGIT